MDWYKDYKKSRTFIQDTVMDPSIRIYENSHTNTVGYFISNVTRMHRASQ